MPYLPYLGRLAYKDLDKVHGQEQGKAKSLLQGVVVVVVNLGFRDGEALNVRNGAGIRTRN